MLTQQKELLQERLETMSDYTTLKKERAELHGQTRLLRKQLDEAQEENRLLHTGEEQLQFHLISNRRKRFCQHLSRFPAWLITIR